MDFMFFVNSVLLGIALAMDAFSVSIADGLSEPEMKRKKQILIASSFAVFQAIMPLIGYTCVHTVVTKFQAVEKFIPYIACIVLVGIAINMIVESRKKDDEDEKKVKVTVSVLLLQSVATSIDALSVGFTIAEYSVLSALVCALIIAVITFGICIAGIVLGKKIGQKYSRPAQTVGACILILIGVEMVVKSFI